MILPRENQDDCVDMKTEGIFPNRRVYSTGLQGHVWQKTQVSQGKIFLAFCYHNNSPDRGIIKIYLRQHLLLHADLKIVCHLFS